MKIITIAIELQLKGLVEADYKFQPEDFIRDLRQVVLELLSDNGKEVTMSKVEISGKETCR